jgi:uncharacterized membrane protein
MEIILGLYVIVGLLLAGLSIPLIRGQVGPNHLYGFRVKQTLENPAVWYPVNAFAAWGLLWVGLAICAAAIGLYFVPGLILPVYSLLLLAVVLVGLAINLILSFRYLARVVKRERKEPGP